MSWTFCDRVQDEEFDEITLLASPDKQFISFSVKVGLSLIAFVSDGTFIQFQNAEGKDLYFAYRITNRPGTQPWKIYKGSRP